MNATRESWQFWHATLAFRLISIFNWKLVFNFESSKWRTLIKLVWGKIGRLDPSLHLCDDKNNFIRGKQGAPSFLGRLGGIRPQRSFRGFASVFAPCKRFTFMRRHAAANQPLCYKYTAMSRYPLQGCVLIFNIVASTSTELEYE